MPRRERLAAHPAVKAGARVAQDLAPIWWVARAYVLVLVAAAVFAAPVTKTGGVPRFDSAEAGAVLLALVLLGSVALGIAGRRRRGHPTFNTFPIRYFAPGTRRVANPDAAPGGLNPPDLTPGRPSSP